MKFLLALIPLGVSAAVLDKPKGFSGTSAASIQSLDLATLFYQMKFLPTYTGVITDKTRLPGLSNNTVKKAIRFGPFTLPSQKDEPKKSIISTLSGGLMPPPERGELNILAKVNSLCTDCFVIRSTTYMEYEDGTLASPATGIYNHHAVIYQSEQMPMYASCETKSFARAKKASDVFAGSAADGGSLEALTKAYSQNYTSAIKRGSYTRPGAKMAMLTQLMNYHDEPQKVYVIAEAEYIPGRPEGWLETNRIQISVTGCDPKLDFELPQGPYSRSSAEYTVPKDVLLVSMSGHMHDGGDNVELMINGKVACLSKAIYGTDGEVLLAKNGKAASSITGLTACTDPVQLKKGDTLSVRANYDATLHPMRMGNNGDEESVMGIGFFELVTPIDAAYP